LGALTRWLFDDDFRLVKDDFTTRDLFCSVKREVRMTSTRDAAELTSSLLEWTSDLFPDAVVAPAPTRTLAEPPKKPPPENQVTLFLAAVRGLNGDRRGDALSRRLQLEYAFEVAFADPLAQHQAIADLAFALLEREDVGDAAVRSDASRVTATFELHRSRELPRAKRVQQSRFDLRPNTRILGIVQAENGVRVARARLQLRDDSRMIIADENGSFAFEAPDGAKLKAIVSARGKSTDVELQPNKSNIITLAMES
jgi:hypothetical protein